MMFIYVVLCLSWAVNSLGQLPIRHCPPKFSRHGHYCFTLTEPTSMFVEGYEHPLCKNLDAMTFSVHSWKEQRAAEKFLKAHGVYERVWLRLFLGVLEFRPATKTIYSPENLHPKTSHRRFKCDKNDCRTRAGDRRHSERTYKRKQKIL